MSFLDIKVGDYLDGNAIRCFRDSQMWVPFRRDYSTILAIISTIWSVEANESNFLLGEIQFGPEINVRKLLFYRE